MNRVSGLVTFIPKTCFRRLSLTQIRYGKPDLSKIKKYQKLFQEDDGVPIYLKGGPVNYVFYYTTVALVFIGCSASLHSIYKLINKK